MAILRDTGAAQSLIVEDALPFSVDSASGDEVLLQGVELGHVSVPLHTIYLQCDLVVGPVTIGVRPSLPVKGVAVILGNDLAGNRVTSDDVAISDSPLPSCAVTRAMAKRMEVGKLKDDERSVHMSNPNGQALGDSVAKELVSAQEITKESESNFVLTRQELIKEQGDDPEIQELCQSAIEEADISTVPRCYFLKQGVLMRKWRPPVVPASQEWSVVYQIVIPRKYCETVLSLAHDTPMAGHMGVNKTHHRVLQHFYWPGISKDVKKLPDLSIGGEA